MIIIHAELYVQAANEPTFLEEILPLIEASRMENGNISYSLMKNTDKEHSYTMVEVWQDMTAVQLHNKSKHFSSFVNKAPQYLAAPLNVKMFEGNEISK